MNIGKQSGISLRIRASMYCYIAKVQSLFAKEGGSINQILEADSNDHAATRK